MLFLHIWTSGPFSDSKFAWYRLRGSKALCLLFLNFWWLSLGENICLQMSDMFFRKTPIFFSCMRKQWRWRLQPRALQSLVTTSELEMNELGAEYNFRQRFPPPAVSSMKAIVLWWQSFYCRSPGSTLDGLFFTVILNVVDFRDKSKPHHREN